LTIGELNSATAEWGASIGLAREELRGRYLAIFATGASAQQAAGPALVTFLLVRAGGWAWLAMGGVMLGAASVGASSPSTRSPPRSRRATRRCGGSSPR
jgi:MFS family permease